MANNNDAIDLMNENQRLRDALLTILDNVDYTSGACRMNETIGGILPAIVIRQARDALRSVKP